MALDVIAGLAGEIIRQLLKQRFEQTVSELSKAQKATEILIGFLPGISRKDSEQFSPQSRTAMSTRTKTLRAAQQKVDSQFASIMKNVQPIQSEFKIPGFLAVESDLDEIRQHKLDSSWLTNMVRISATPSMIRTLARNKKIAFIMRNSTVELPKPIETTSANLGTIRKRETRHGQTWGLKSLRIQELWNEGFRGDGVVVGHLDTGVDASHPDLLNKVADFSLFDPRGFRVPKCDAFDSGSHGTHTAGTIVGGDYDGVAIGVAPNAKLISGGVLLGGKGTLWQIIKGMEWLASKKVRIINMSLSGVGYLPDYEYALERLAALGIFTACSIGNEGLAVTGSPGNIMSACGVGAIDPEQEPADFSGGASISYYDPQGKRIDVDKPDVVAPGDAVFSAVPDSQWGYKNGTSMAAPHVAGVAALLLQAEPSATLEQLLIAIYETARHPGTKKPRRDSRFGRGVISPLDALKKLRALKPTP